MHVNEHERISNISQSKVKELHCYCSLTSYSHSRVFSNINILPLVDGAMVDYHTREKISHSGKRISPETKFVIRAIS